jgi:hypothetical protein
VNPTEDQALQFAVMLQAGLPSSQAILYFVETDDAAELTMILKRWMRSKAVRSAINKLQRKPWDQMSLEERMKAALDQHYNSLAFLLFSVNYIEANSTDKTKLDTARQAIESKLAGSAGKLDALSQFFDDINSGKVKLNSKPTSSFPGLNGASN